MLEVLKRDREVLMESVTYFCVLPRSGGALRSSSSWLWTSKGLAGACVLNVSKELKGDREFATVIVMHKCSLQSSSGATRKSPSTVVRPFSCLLVGSFCAVHA